jgi:hypothetical protein
MARKPQQSETPPAVTLPASGGAYELVDGQLIPVSAPEETAGTNPETPSETGA